MNAPGITVGVPNDVPILQVVLSARVGQGFTLNADGVSCDDRDECRDGNGGCAQICAIETVAPIALAGTDMY